MDFSRELEAALPASACAALFERTLARGQSLFLRGEKPQAMYCVLSGEVRLVRTLESGAEVILQRATQGVVAEASFDQAVYHCDAVAVSPSTLLGIPQHVLRQALDVPKFRDFWIGMLAAELRQLRLQNERLGLRTARERIWHYIEAEGRDGVLELAQSLKSWASQLGVTHEALYRTLHQMKASGELVQQGGTLRISG